MKKRDGDKKSVRGGSGGAPDFNKKKRLGGKGLSLDAFVGAKSIKPLVTASQIRKQREAYQNSKKVNKYRKALKHLAEEGHEFRSRVPLSIDPEIIGQDLFDSGTQRNEEKPSSSAGEREPSSIEAEKGQIGGHGKKSGKGRQPKPLSHLERLREEYEKKKQEEEKIRREKQALFEEQQAAREKSKKNGKRCRINLERQPEKDNRS